MDTCHVDGGHVVQIHYEYLGRRLHRVQRGLESVSHTEEQRPVDGENFHSVGHVVFVRDRDLVPGCLVLPGNAGWRPVNSPMRRMNSNDAGMTPVYTATVKSNTTVSAKVRSITDQSDLGP